MSSLRSTALRSPAPPVRGSSRQGRAVRALALGLLLSLSLVACARPLLSPQVAAIVNGEEISASQVEELADESAGQVDPNTGAPADPALAVNTAISRLTLVAVLADTAEALDADVPGDDEVQATIDEQIESIGGAEQAEQVLEAQGIGPSTLELDIRTSLLIEAIVGVLQDGVEITEEQVQAAYEAQFAVPNVAHILVETAEAAQEVVARIEGGEPFEVVAQEVSVDTGSAAQGGVLGPLNQGFIPEFVEAAEALEPGELSAPVETQFGFHVIRVDEAPPLDDALREQIETQLADQGVNQPLLDAVGAQLLDADVTVNPRYGVWDPTINPDGSPGQLVRAGSVLGDVRPVLDGDAAVDPLLPADG